MMKKVCTVLMVVMVIVWYGNAAEMTCLEAGATLLPCLEYVSGPAAAPSQQCCAAATVLSKGADTTEKRRFLCGCFKEAAKAFPFNADKTKKLPQLCHIQTPIPIDPNVDCNSIP